MPRLKTHSGASKRFKVTGTGKLIFKRTNKRHLLRKRTTTRKRRLAIEGIVRNCDFRRLSCAMLLKSKKLKRVKVAS
ncbi:MAG: 50S ribosomal protein L35 [Bacteroidia bacterium]|nr:50S ribosomal protein L35 [Bacteroidia bacterium]MDW8159400.1 50S ribosomal protein L35 [Bacteroidia bacterium]